MFLNRCLMAFCEINNLLVLKARTFFACGSSVRMVKREYNETGKRCPLMSFFSLRVRRVFFQNVQSRFPELDQS